MILLYVIFQRKMDLLTSYNSDEIDNEKNPNKSATSALKEIDIIQLDDTDTETEDPPLPQIKCPSSQVDEKKEMQPSCSKEDATFPSGKVIECIDIDESSDSEKSASPLKNHSSAPKIDSTSDKTDANKTDYLNLYGTASEDDEQEVQDSVNNLLTSAAILTHDPCGPKKPCADNEILIDGVVNLVNKLDSESRVLVSPLLKSFDSSSQCGSRMHTPDLSLGGCDKNSALIDSNVNKRFKRDTETPKSSASATNTDLYENEELGTSNSFLYRKDERINAAFAKSVVCRLPRQITRHYVGHSNVVTSLNWCIPQYSHLLLSASSDATVKIWDMYCKHPVQCIKSNLGLKAAKWSLTGEQIVTGGYGKKTHVYDVLSGKEIISYDIFHYVNSIEIHPYMEDVFLCGTRNAIFGFDLRVNTSLPIRTFLSKCEEVLDIVFLDENEFICSTNVVNHDSADRTIMVWDFSTGAIMSNQIYLERYTCPSLKVHPDNSCFIAQTNGDYIAAFSSCKPYKIKDKRYRGHKVSGFGIECDISPDGKYLASGDANGDVYFYNYANTNVINKLTARPNVATNRLKWHPALNSTLAVATWDGHVQIWK